jgi:hypothetical protein
MSYAVNTPSPTLADRLVGASLPLILGAAILVMFVLSGGVLWKLGVNYDGSMGSPITKLHPAFYLSSFAMALYLAARPDPIAFLGDVIVRNPGAVVLLLTALVNGVYLAALGRPGIPAPFDTFVLPALLAILLLRQEESFKSRIEKGVHLLLAANACLALVEMGIGHRFFPAVVDGVPFEFDTRSTALIGHPLMNATVTGVYVISLMAGGGRIAPGLRAGLIALQLLALVAFGGRTATVLVLAFLAFFLLRAVALSMFTWRLSPASAGLLVMAAPAAAVAVLVLAQSGFFDQLLARFAGDTASTQARLLMFELLAQTTWRDLVVGPDPETLRSMQHGLGLEMGIENPTVRFILRHGAIMAFFIHVGVIAFMTDETRRCRPAVLFPVAFFAVIAMTFESLSPKTILFAQVMTIMSLMFRRPPAPDRLTR